MLSEPLTENPRNPGGAILLVLGLLLGGAGMAFIAAAQTPAKPSVRIVIPSTANTEPTTSSTTTTTVAPVQRLSTTTTTLPPPIYGPGSYIVGNGPDQIPPGLYHVTRYGPDVQDPSGNVCRFHTPQTTYVYGSSGSGGPMDLTSGTVTAESGCMAWTKLY